MYVFPKQISVFGEDRPSIIVTYRFHPSAPDALTGNTRLTPIFIFYHTEAYLFLIPLSYFFLLSSLPSPSVPLLRGVIQLIDCLASWPTDLLNK